MKRLLAYLFIALGLGLTFNVNANAKEKYNDFNKYKFCDKSGTIQLSDCWDEGQNSFSRFLETYLTKRNKSESDVGRTNQDIFDREIMRLLKEFQIYNLDPNEIFNEINRNGKLKNLLNNSNTKFAKVEPSQTQKVAKKNDFNIYLSKIDNCAKLKNKKPDTWSFKNVCKWAADKHNTEAAYLMSKAWAENESGDYAWEFGVNKSQAKRKALKKCNSIAIKKNNLPCKITSLNEYNIEITENTDPRLVERITGKMKTTKIAKAEPSQTQEVAEKEKKAEIIFSKCSGLRPNYDSNDIWTIDLEKGLVAEHSFKEEGDNKDTANIYWKIKSNINTEIIIAGDASHGKKISDEQIKGINYFNPEFIFNTSKKTIVFTVSLDPKAPKDFKKYFKEELKKGKLKPRIEGHCEVENLYVKTQIAKKEPKKKEKKKKKVAKVVEQEQEEIKVKTKKLDTTGPEIEIAEAITVDDSSYSLKGKVSDKGSDKIYIKVDGQDIPVKKGKFKIDRYSPEDEEVKIVAIDKWGNKSIKVVKVTIDIQEDIIVQKLEPLNPSRVRAKTSGEKVALIIGIENYTEAPKANYANLDAKYFFDYARKAFGVKKQNINLLINEDATFVKTSKALTLWLRTKVKADQTDLIIFFAGHGLASSDGKELYLIAQDSDPNLLSRTALSRTELFAEIINLKPKSVTMFLDTCYSGVSRDEQMLLASARPIRIVADQQEGIPDNFTIFTASQLDQISSGLKEANHGIFSYYLMKGLEGKADENKDYKITNGELLAYMDLNVSQKASELGRQQNPSLAGDPDQVLMSYR